mgnify:CR=1 FL=1
MNDKLAWAYLSRVVEGPSRHVQALLSAGRSAEEIAHGVRTRASWVGPLLGETESRYAFDSMNRDLEQAAAVGGRLITPEDDEWPTEEFDVSFGFATAGASPFPRTYQSDAVAPHALWVRGGNLSGMFARSLGVVGTRTMSTYGRAATTILVTSLSSHRYTVVSGGAMGIDTAAHEAALSVGGTTVAFFACGIDRTYPSSNAALFEKIAGSGGALISEYAPGLSPKRHRFLTRNRLVAAVTQGSVVVEAGFRSGALNTLTWCSGLGRVSMAVPGPITSNTSTGCHHKIRDGQAQLVTSGDDVRSLLEPVGTLDVDGQYELALQPDAIQRLSRNELRIYDALPTQGARDTSDVAQDAGLPIALTVHILVDLQRRGLVARDGASWQRGEVA